MHPLNAVLAARMLFNTASSVSESVGEAIPFGSPWWFIYAGISCFLVLFAGIMSGLTLGLMSLGLVELEILQRSGTSTEKKTSCCYFASSSKTASAFGDFASLQCCCYGGPPYIPG